MANKYKTGSACTKCGELGATSKFERVGMKTEYIDRTCRNCGYQWSELPLDSQTSEQKNLADSSASPVQHLKAEIAEKCDEIAECYKGKFPEETIKNVLSVFRQLSAVE